METESYQLEFERKDGFLYARASGERTRDTVTALTFAILEAAREADFPRVLIDVRALEGRLSVLDSYLVVTQVFERLRGQGVNRAAILDEQISSRREWFIETVARNRGFNFRVFPDEAEALAWLRR
jgi:hypothetical protein